MQEHVSETLRRAVEGNRVGHAYLFCGPRGVGKTTLARVLAMALNCPDRSEDAEPCGVCQSCTRIWGGHTALDVVEIDAASNRGVDDARDLRERAMYAPSGDGAYKVYIVDEAHMLTREAWNALLKVLEEPPPRVIFIFATTEPQKIEQTAAPILSRCQRFDFRRIGVSDIVARLSSVLEQEGTPAHEEALRLIGRKADGGMRDALSLLDQVISLTGEGVDVEAVRRVLGLVEDERYLELLGILAEGRHAEVFTLVERLVDEGYDLVEFYHGLLDVLRTLLRMRLSPDAEVDLTADLRASFAERAALFAPADLVRMLAAAAELEGQGSLRRSPNPRILIEMLLLRLSYLDRTVELEELIRALGGAPAGMGGAGSPSGHGGASGDPAGAGSSADRPAGDAGSSHSAVDRAQNVTPPSTKAATDDRPPTPDASANGEAPQSRSAAAIETAPVAIPADDIVPSPGAPEAWRRWLEAGHDVPTGLGTFLRSATVERGEGDELVVLLLASSAVDRVSAPAAQATIVRGLSPYLGYVPRLAVRGPAEAGSQPSRVTQAEVRNDTLNALFRQEPRLREAVQELDLELMD